MKKVIMILIMLFVFTGCDKVFMNDNSGLIVSSKQINDLTKYKYLYGFKTIDIQSNDFGNQTYSMNSNNNYNVGDTLFIGVLND